MREVANFCLNPPPCRTSPPATGKFPGRACTRQSHPSSRSGAGAHTQPWSAVAERGTSADTAFGGGMRVCARATTRQSFPKAAWRLRFPPHSKVVRPAHDAHFGPMARRGIPWPNAAVYACLGAASPWGTNCETCRPDISKRFSLQPFALNFTFVCCAPHASGSRHFLAFVEGDCVICILTFSRAKPCLPRNPRPDAPSAESRRSSARRPSASSARTAAS